MYNKIINSIGEHIISHHNSSFSAVNRDMNSHFSAGEEEDRVFYVFNNNINWFIRQIVGNGCLGFSKISIPVEENAEIVPPVSSFRDVGGAFFEIGGEHTAHIIILNLRRICPSNCLG